ncbi:hypothetical protein U14_05343 [Candidatus Moduliflexus flocculans]|uniref:DUF1232 domain-containing protein n=1 Tax=Candidatus Moduliflexus flocculans TaxID=1499966 RepID=A0A081BRN5_9BACT|nr:hypothetical protein U14_05343 [Candidatus Moduliflexus flocculans]
MFRHLKFIAKRIFDEINVYRRLAIDPRTPWLPKILLVVAVAYFVSPIDLIPDVIPLLGALDDLLIVPGLIWLAVKLIPPALIAEHRANISI